MRLCIRLIPVLALLLLDERPRVLCVVTTRLLLLLQKLLTSRIAVGVHTSLVRAVGGRRGGFGCAHR